MKRKAPMSSKMAAFQCPGGDLMFSGVLAKTVEMIGLQHYPV